MTCLYIVSITQLYETHILIHIQYYVGTEMWLSQHLKIILVSLFVN